MKQHISLIKDVAIIIGLIGSVATFAVGWGVLTNKVEAMELKESPSRTEFNTLCGDVKEIKTDVKTILINFHK
jgi:hypothetical protein